MGQLRFRRSIRILPGLRLNLGKRGISASVGVRGAHVTVGHGKVRETVGIPGTGLSYTETQTPGRGAAERPREASDALPAADPPGNAVRGVFWLLLVALAAWAVWRALTA